jgi:hypothetical protein
MYMLDPIPNAVSKSPWLFEYKPTGGGRRKRRKTNRRNRSAKNKTRRRYPKKKQLKIHKHA